jgi:DNA-binding NarL/FixJ family response regulator
MTLLGRGAARAMVVDDDRRAAGRLREILAAAGAVVVAPGARSSNGVELARSHSPDVAFVDVGPPRSGDAALIEDLIGLGLGIRVVVMRDVWEADGCVSAIRAGAAGCVTKPALLAGEIPRVLEAVMSGHLVCSQQLEPAIVAALRWDHAPDGKPGSGKPCC